LQDLDFYEARNQLEDPEGLFLEVEKSGLHVIGFTRDGRIFLDGSGQFTDGMDISALLDLDGDLETVVSARERKDEIG
jgi:hypothetical protein